MRWFSDELFFEQFQGWPWGGPGKEVQIDAVSGATLTSLALAEGVLKRIGGDRPSLVFPESISVSEVATWYDGATAIDDSQDHRGRERCLPAMFWDTCYAAVRGPTRLLGIKVRPRC